MLCVRAPAKRQNRSASSSSVLLLLTHLTHRFLFCIPRSLVHCLFSRRFLRRIRIPQFSPDLTLQEWSDQSSYWQPLPSCWSGQRLSLLPRPHPLIALVRTSSGLSDEPTLKITHTKATASLAGTLSIKAMVQLLWCLNLSLEVPRPSSFPRSRLCRCSRKRRRPARSSGQRLPHRRP